MTSHICGSDGAEPFHDILHSCDLLALAQDELLDAIGILSFGACNGV